VEVQERVRPPGEVAALALPQLRELAQLRQQWLQAIKIFVRGVPHTSSMAPGTGRRNSGHAAIRSDLRRHLFAHSVP
jgi:hypothetical protein